MRFIRTVMRARRWQPALRSRSKPRRAGPISTEGRRGQEAGQEEGGQARPRGAPAIRCGQDRRRRWRRAQSASMPRAALPAPLRCRSTARPGRRCASPATATGATPSSSRSSRSWPSRRKQQDGWPGLLVGDLSQPRGGPMLTGHASHQVGLDADIWLTPMPDRRLSEQEREDLSATSMLAADQVSVDPKVWTRRPRAPPQARRLLPRRGAHFRASRHQEGAVRGGCQGH